MSTFYADGFQDCINFLGFLPPDKYINHNGETNVFRQEYTEGYEAAQRIIAKGKIKQFKREAEL